MRRLERGQEHRDFGKLKPEHLPYFAAVLPVPECPTQSLADGLREGSS